MRKSQNSIIFSTVPDHASNYGGRPLGWVRAAAASWPGRGEEATAV